MNLMSSFLQSVRVLAIIAPVLFSTGTLSAQNTHETPATAGLEELVVKPLRLPALQEVGGSPFLTAEYQEGAVVLDEHKTVAKVPVKFNIFSNAIMVQKDGQDMKLESFREVYYDEPGANGTVKHMVFRQGYPEIDNHTEKSVYQVLAGGPSVQLLKFMSQKVEEASTLGDYSRRELVTTQQLYIYTPAGGIKKIKNSKQSLTDALPAFSAKIEELSGGGKLNLKTESGISELVQGLNKP